MIENCLYFWCDKSCFYDKCNTLQEIDETFKTDRSKFAKFGKAVAKDKGKENNEDEITKADSDEEDKEEEKRREEAKKKQRKHKKLKYRKRTINFVCIYLCILQSDKV